MSFTRFGMGAWSTLCERVRFPRDSLAVHAAYKQARDLYNINEALSRFYTQQREMSSAHGLHGMEPLAWPAALFWPPPWLPSALRICFDGKYEREG